MSAALASRIEVTIRVTDDSFESKLSIPVESTKAQRDAFAKLWIDGMATAFKQAPAQEQP